MGKLNTQIGIKQVDKSQITHSYDTEFSLLLRLKRIELSLEWSAFSFSVLAPYRSLCSIGGDTVPAVFQSQGLLRRNIQRYREEPRLHHWSGRQRYLDFPNSAKHRQRLPRLLGPGHIQNQPAFWDQGGPYFFGEGLSRKRHMGNGGSCCQPYGVSAKRRKVGTQF